MRLPFGTSALHFTCRFARIVNIYFCCTTLALLLVSRKGASKLHVMKRKILLIAGIVVAIVVGLFTGLFGAGI